MRCFGFVTVPIAIVLLANATACSAFATTKWRPTSGGLNASKINRDFGRKPTISEATPKESRNEHDYDGDDVDEEGSVVVGGHRDRRRRTTLAALLSSFVAIPNAATASNDDDDDGFSTMNDFARGVRTSVVRGARLVDRADGMWEQFSDDLGLGRERNQPKRNGIDAGGNGRSKEVVRSEEAKGDPVALDGEFAHGLLRECDEAFLACLKSQQSSSALSERELIQQIDETKQLLRKSFFSSSSAPTPVEEFNFECYAHFRTFNEILVRRNVNFPPFRKEFESTIGARLLRLTSFSPSSSSTGATASLQNALGSVDAAAELLRGKGLIASWQRSVPLEDDVEDFAAAYDGRADKPAAEDFGAAPSDVPFSLALEGDVTLDAQLLLQELGYRLYPSFGRWLVREGLLLCFDDGGTVAVQVDDYYMDTGYSSNPNLFEVKQVLLNIVIRRD